MGHYSQKAGVPAGRTNAERLGRANPPLDPLDSIATIWSVWSGLPAAGAAHTSMLWPREIHRVLGRVFCDSTLWQGGG